MSKNEKYLSFDEETGTWKLLPDPYALITVYTKSDFERIIKALEFYSKEHPNVTITFQAEVFGEEL